MDKKNAIYLLNKYILFLIENKYQIKQVFLFGSYTKGIVNKNSDIDVAIVIENLGNSYDEFLKLMKYRRNFDYRIEPHPFDASDFNNENPFAAEILKTGIKIF
ncbi:MAG: nucleotidyltransferase domain-containing protein [Spirochaetes bacterium]|nr:nucleotidyltransferase domain-containing protein [Spirochaetota bacterium]